MEADQKNVSMFRSVRLSVLFCDIKGFTSMARRLESEKINALLHSFIRSMSVIVHRHSGEIDKVMGDGVLAVFAPASSRRSPAHQAVSAALAMQAEAGSLRKSWQAAGGDLLVRIGIATGPVEVSELSLPHRQESALIGHHVNLASRLQGMAPAGTILVSGETYESTKRSFDFRRVEGLEIKGFDDAVVAYRAGAATGGAAPAEDSDRESFAGITGEDPSADNRRYRRLDLDLDLQIRTPGGNTILRSVNISEGGMFIATEKPAPHGASLTIEARLPTSSGIFPIAIDGRVVWTGGEKGVSGMGVRFTAVHSTEQETMARLVRDIFSLRYRATAEKDGPLRQTAPLPRQGEEPLFRGMELGTSFENLGTVSPDMLSRLLNHEYDRARRYSSDFTCISLVVDLSSGASAQGDIRQALLEVGETLKACLRSTDEFAYFGDGLFFILAPETLLDRAETLIQRTLVNLQARLRPFENFPGSFIIRSGSSAFDRQTMTSPQQIMEAAVSSLAQ